MKTMINLIIDFSLVSRLGRDTPFGMTTKKRRTRVSAPLIQKTGHWPLITDHWQPLP